MSQSFWAIFRLWLCDVHLLSPLRSAEHQSSKRNAIPLKAARVCTQLRQTGIRGAREIRGCRGGQWVTALATQA